MWSQVSAGKSYGTDIADAYRLPGYYTNLRY